MRSGYRGTSFFLYEIVPLVLSVFAVLSLVDIADEDAKAVAPGQIPTGLRSITARRAAWSRVGSGIHFDNPNPTRPTIIRDLAIGDLRDDPFDNPLTWYPQIGPESPH